MLSASILRRIARLVESRGMDAYVPVPIRQLAELEGWDVRYRSGMTTVWGMAVIWGPDRIMTINEDLMLPHQRHTMAHEMGHAIAGDQGRFTMSDRPWSHTKQERRADRIAARLLIPDFVIRETTTIDEVAERCVVPRELVEIRLGECPALFAHADPWGW